MDKFTEMMLAQTGLIAMVARPSVAPSPSKPSSSTKALT